MTFGAHSTAPAASQNQACLGCHEDTVKGEWHAGAHERGGVACADCHRVHAPHDDVRSLDRQASVCFDCHPRQRAEVSKPFHHPVEGNAMNCASCHSRTVRRTTLRCAAHRSMTLATPATRRSEARISGSMPRSRRTARTAMCHMARASQPCSSCARHCCASNAIRRRAIRVSPTGLGAFRERASRPRTSWRAVA